jgi:hypothetical protein
LVKKTMQRGITLAVILAARAFAHHGLAVFDQTKPLTLHGTVTEFHFTNPHCIVDVAVKDEKGTIRKWQGELTSPLHLKGWTATSLEPGERVIMTGFPAKSGALYLWITKLEASNGVTLKTNGTNLIPETQ